MAFSWRDYIRGVGVSCLPAPRDLIVDIVDRDVEVSRTNLVMQFSSRVKLPYSEVDLYIDSYIQSLLKSRSIIDGCMPGYYRSVCYVSKT